MKPFCGGRMRFALLPPPTGAMPGALARGETRVGVDIAPPTPSCGLIGWLLGSISSGGTASGVTDGLKKVLPRGGDVSTLFCACAAFLVLTAASPGGGSSGPRRPQAERLVARARLIRRKKKRAADKRHLGSSVEGMQQDRHAPGAGLLAPAYWHDFLPRPAGNIARRRFIDRKFPALPQRVS